MTSHTTDPFQNMTRQFFFSKYTYFVDCFFFKLFAQKNKKFSKIFLLMCIFKKILIFMCKNVITWQTDLPHIDINKKYNIKKSWKKKHRKWRRSSSFDPLLPIHFILASSIVFFLFFLISQCCCPVVCIEPIVSYEWNIMVTWKFFSFFFI